MAGASDVGILRSKFRGCLLGALFGDALGSEFEGPYFMCPVPEKEFKLFSKKNLSKLKANKDPRFTFTDDSAMIMALCRSLLSEKTLDIKHLAREYTETYFREPGRGYGGSVRTVFQKLQDETLEDVTEPARQQFDGSGSYGNGAAMRVAPLALFNHNDLEELKKSSAQNALITHAHAHGVQGAILQAMAVYESLQTPAGTLDVKQFIDKMIAAAEELENAEMKKSEEKSNDEPTPAEEQGSFDEHDGEGPTSYVAQFQSIKEMLVRSKRIQKKPRIQHVIDTVGTGIKAIEAVPAAIFSFLHKSNTCLKDVLFYSMSLGGDTDTIACMAGAIAGAYWGGKDIPKEWFPVTEGVEEITQYADELYELRVSQSTG